MADMLVSGHGSGIRLQLWLSKLGGYGTKSISGKYFGAYPFFLKAPFVRAFASISMTSLWVITTFALLETALLGLISSLKDYSVSSLLLTTYFPNLRPKIVVGRRCRAPLLGYMPSVMFMAKRFTRNDNICIFVAHISYTGHVYS